MRAAQLTAAVNAKLVRADGIYIDGLKSDGTQSAHASQESNALALAYGIVPPDLVQAVGRFVAGLGLSVSPNHGLELLRGLANAGFYGDMVHTLTDTSVPGWASIVAGGGSFTWETWTPSDLVGDSMSHGWGASALVAMHESLLGIQLLTPDASGTVRAAIVRRPRGLTRREAPARRSPGPSPSTGGARAKTPDAGRSRPAECRGDSGTPCGERRRGAGRRASLDRAAGVTVEASRRRRGRRLSGKRLLPLHRSVRLIDRIFRRRTRSPAAVSSR